MFTSTSQGSTTGLCGPAHAQQGRIFSSVQPHASKCSLHRRRSRPPADMRYLRPPLPPAMAPRPQRSTLPPALTCSLALLTAFAIISVSLLGVFPTDFKAPLYVTQKDLTTEGLGAALMHLRKTTVLTHQLGSCLKVPGIKSTHGYYVRQFFPKCSAALPWGPSACRVKTVLTKTGWKYWMEGEGDVPLNRLGSCRTIHVINPDLRDYENRYNTTAFLVQNLKVRDEHPLNCTGIDAVFHYRYGDIARDRRQRVSKQVHYHAVHRLISSGKVSPSSLLIVTDLTGKKHIEGQFPGARFFTKNDPAALKQCAGKATKFIGGGSTYAYVCFQMIRPNIVYTANVNAKSRVRYPRNMTVDIAM
ncbi:unnamed protein product [Chondrus crispus]|uniref:Uncharacterized protein n=1 Tax=Chondrus crispus TaxID=2769 RepID=R7QMU7_CHOCR|nr:unnamed protein product [Chondrus crispus]CDF38806.1 unnamed protein product [Chondrus crispus]|eukprot:XP_005718711.1 unnamed protein product [Chondrus crispus]